jgi:hypothetical protein
MDLQLIVQLGDPFHGKVVNRKNEVVFEMDQTKYDWMVQRGFLNHYKDTRGLWNFLYDLRKVTEGDSIKAVVR